MGTKLWIWKQGPFYPQLGKKIIELPCRVNPGPSDAQIAIEGFEIQPNARGNFLESNYSVDEIDAIHTYGIMRMVIDYYEKVIGNPVIWYWNRNGYTAPLVARINRDGIDARYSRDSRSIFLDRYGFEYNRIHHCRSVDLVAHETAHAILDGLKPAWEHGNPETRGMAEAFCDFAAMFWILSQKDMCSEVIAETCGDLRTSNMLSLFGVGHGFEELPGKAIREANNHTKLKKDHWNPYHYCEAITGLLYAALVEEYELLGDRKFEPDALYELGNKWAEIILWTYVKCPEIPTLELFLNYFRLHWFGNDENMKKLLKERWFF